MPEEQVTLITLLREVILGYEDKLVELETVNSSALTMNRDKIERFRDDIQAIIDIDLHVIEDILNELNLDPEEKEKTFNYLRRVKQLLQLNQREGTTYKIQGNQLSQISHFFERIDEEIEKNTKIQDEHMRNVGKLTSICKKYKKLLGLLEDKNNTTFIDDVDLIALLFKECSIDEKTKRNILLSIMKYNKTLFDKNLATNQFEVHLKRLNVEDVKRVFSEHGYDFCELKPREQEDILKYANLNNINEMFECLESLEYEKFDLTKSMGRKLAAILINCNKDLFTSVVNYSKQKGINQNDLLDILPALIEQSPHHRRKSTKRTPGDPKPHSPVMCGRSDDYIKNIEYLESLGFKMDFVMNKCRDILIMPNERLIENCETYLKYGFTFNQDENGTLRHPALSCLQSLRLAEIADQFIEICPEGHQYIKENMSRLKSITSPNHLIMYNIYASYMTEDNKGRKLIPEGPFVLRKNQSSKLRLRGEITRYPDSGYKDIPYRDIEEDNKEPATMTIEVPIKNKEEFDEAVKATDELEEKLPNLVENDENLRKLDEYIDPEDDIRYNFNGVLISKLKVERIYNILKNNNLEDLEDSLLYAITYNTIINQQDFAKLEEIVKSRRK